MDDNRKEWQKPELIVLVRSRPEEAVLVGCKATGVVPVVNNWDDNRCKISECGTCNAHGTS